MAEPEVIETPTDPAILREREDYYLEMRDIKL